ncbi:PEP-CTERM sorting domain-containing protein [Rubellicoccus peritrichatus]|uniref:PEP-CTERM sorting domain-containing protein n=1 Tax=Rubellicoccus peritrichatus TaxID=3080537 RepID=A0AAQ3L658_9BACT|nr:PEP-CTERM sorting domain-containing protein [Puniceicoccus sp. CR14]WOO39995.1 PEP-CTERM sorting domain-containing protein [Puniceicoccus sp. CR14]
MNSTATTFRTLLLTCALITSFVSSIRSYAVTFTWQEDSGTLNGLFTDAAHWTPGGGPPGAPDDAVINFDNSGVAYTVSINGTIRSLNNLTLSSADAILAINATTAGSGLTVANGFTNSGTIRLDGNNDTGEAAFLTITTGSLTNDGTFDFDSSSDSLDFTGGLINNGSVNIRDAGVDFNGGSANQFTNNAVFTIENTGSLTIDNSNETFTQAGGTLVNDGAFNMTNATFVFSGGNVTGNTLALGSNADLEIAGTGTGSLDVTFTGAGHDFTGDVHSGQQILIQSTTASATVTSASGFTNDGTIILDGNNDTGETSSLILTSGSLTNNGALTFDTSSDVIAFTGGLINNGTVAVSDAGVALNGGAANQFTNNSAFTINSGASIVIDNASETFTQAAGTLANDGSFNITNASFIFSGGNVTGNTLNFGSNSDLEITGTGTGSLDVTFTGAGHDFTGDLHSGQQLLIQSTTASATVTSASSFINDGTIILDGNNDTGETSSLILTTGSLTNNGALTFDSSSDAIAFTGGLINNGTVAVSDAGVALNGGAANQFTNNSAFTINSGASIVIDNASETFTQAAGTLANNGSFDITNATFVFSGGNVTGNTLNFGSNSDLEITGTGTGSLDVTFTGAGHDFTGDVHAGQQLLIQTTTASATVTSASGFTNDGTIILDGNTDVGETSSLILTTGSLTNNGTLTFDTSSDAIAFTGGLINNGIVTVGDAGVALNGGAVNQFTNNAAFTINSGASIFIDNSSETFTQANGTLANNGAFNMTSATFEYTGGTITGNAISLGTNADLDLQHDGAGVFTFTNGGHDLSGNVAAAQTINITATTANATVTAANGFTNAGTINFNGNTDVGETAQLTVSSGTLNNTGTINFNSTQDSHNLIATLANSGTVTVNDFGVAITGTFTNESGGTVMGAGSFAVSGGDFINNGTIAPGNSIGTLTINDNVDNSSTSVLTLELATGPTNDLLVVNGSFEIDGELELTLLGGYIPGISDVFTVVQASSILGSIGDFTNVAGDGSFSFLGGTGFARIAGNDIELFDISIVPEPSIAALLIGSCGLLAFLRRRKRG